MEKFDTSQLLQPYGGLNPLIMDIQNKFLEYIGENGDYNITNKELDSVLEEIDSLDYEPKYMLCAINIKSYAIAITLQKANNNKKFKKIKFIGVQSYDKNKITIHQNLDYPLNDFENEVLLKNYQYEGYFFKNPKWYAITPLSGKYIAEQFNIKDRVPDKVYCEGIIAETNTQYLLYGKGKMFWVYKEDIGNLFEKQWEDVVVDFKKINNLNSKGYSLYPFQEKGVQFALYEKYAFILFDQGMGKTLTSISAAIAVEAKNVLVVTLAALKVNWKREIEAMGQTAKIISGSKWNDEDTKFTVINYDILRKFHTVKPKKGQPVNRTLADQKFDVIILDEGHKCKSPTSQRSQVINHLAKLETTNYMWVLSGTLIEKNEDFFNVCRVMNVPIGSLIVTNDSKLEWKTYRDYQLRYCNKFPIIKEINGRNQEILITPKSKGERIENSNTLELRQRIKQKYYRVLKEKELDGFVKKYRTPLYFELSQKELKKYNKLFENYIKEKKEQGIVVHEDAARLTESIKLRQYLAEIKTPHTIAFAKSLFEDEEKVIIFTHFKKEFEKIVKGLGNKIVYVEAGKNKQNQEAIDKFQNDPKVLGIVGNILTLGTGHNLTKGDNTIINSPDWNSREHEQAEDRSWRLGREEDVNIYYMLFENTEEEVVYKRSESKKANKKIFFNE